MTVSEFLDLSDTELIERMIPFDNWYERDDNDHELFQNIRRLLIERLTTDVIRLEAALSYVQRLTQEQRLAHGKDSEVYWVAVNAGRASEPKQMFDACVAWVARSEAFWRQAAVDILAQLEDGQPMSSASMALILDRLNDDDCIVESALYAIGHLNPETPVFSEVEMQRLNSFVASSSAEIRRAAVSALTAANFPAGVPGLIALSRDEDTEIRDWATFGLGCISELDTPELREALVARLEDEDDDTRQEAMGGLASRKDGRAVPVIRRELEEDRITGVLLGAIEALPDPNYITFLEPYLSKNSDDQNFVKAMTACLSARQEKHLFT